MAESKQKSGRAVLYELKQLQIKYHALDCEKRNKSKEYKNLFFLVEELDNKSNKELHNEKYHLRQQIMKIKSKVTHFKRTLKDIKGEPSSVEKIKEKLEDIEKSILFFKEKQKEVYEQLLNNERIIWQELTAYKRQIDSWTTSENHITPLAGHITRVETEESTTMPHAVTALQEFLFKNGGHTGGWEEVDHQTFVKLWTKYKGTQNMLGEAEREIPSHTLQDIERHLEWYNKYIQLQEENRKTISEWRKLKKVEKKQAVINAVKENRVSQSLDEMKKREKEREDKKLKIQQWKEEQEKLKLAVAEKEKMKKDLEITTQKRKQQERQELVKKQLEDYTQKKNTERKKQLEIEKAKALEQKERGKFANKQLQLYQTRDTEMLKAKQDLLATQYHENELKKARLDKIKEKVQIEHDPFRILKPTLNWKEKQKEKDETIHTYSLACIPKRSIPSWRQGLY